MTSPKFPTMTGSMVYPWWGSSTTDNWNQIQDSLEYGGTAIRARVKKPVRHWVWSAPRLKEEDFDAIMGFLRDRMKAGEVFYVDNPLADVYSPYDAPTLTQAAGGALAERTWYVTFSFSDGTGETRDSQETSLTVLVNQQLTVDVPEFPNGVTQANIYAGTVSGTLYYVSKVTTSNSTWTEVETAVDAASASGQKTLNVTSTTGYQIGDIIVIDVTGAGGGTEYAEVLTITAGVSLNLVASLTYTHNATDKVNHATNVLGDAAPTSNSLQEELKVMLERDPSWTMHSPDIYSMTLYLKEQR